MPLTAAELEALARTPAAASTDAGSATARSADDVLKLDAAAAGVDALTGPNGQGGAKSAFRCLRPARAGLPGASGRSRRGGV
jgi:hypothetical protein